uniref:F-box/FBD/LRR-repeat protein At1g66290 family n=2 Tax=Cajanus cajan TaxID=3821 RepID=A0A151S3A6_CAJCA|nr:Putative F-box/FBD/LRR-repeat protein At1g66290 family [Cajanus cajan]
MVPSLHIQCSEPIMKQYESLNEFMALRRTQKVTSFHLKCNSDHDCSPRYLGQWVYEIVARKVEQVNISLRHINVFDEVALFTCTTIVNLKLNGPFSIHIPPSVHLPNLKTLHLNTRKCSFKIASNLISGSPALELFLFNDHFNDYKIMRNSRVIQFSKLNALYHLVIQSEPPHDFISDYCQGRELNIVKAKVYMTVYRAHAERIVAKILKSLRNVELLSFSYFRNEMDLSNFDFPLFKNLVELRIFLKDAVSLIMGIILVKCPNLQVVEVNIVDDCKSCRYYANGGGRKHDLITVPICRKTTTVRKRLRTSRDLVIV